MRSFCACPPLADARGSDQSPDRKGGLVRFLVRHRVEDGVDGEAVRQPGRFGRVFGHVGVLPGVADIHVVIDGHQHAPAVVIDRAPVRRRGLGLGHDPSAWTDAQTQALQDQIVIRRAPLTAGFKPFGFPTITVPAKMTDDPMMEKLYAAVFIAKYGGIVVVNDVSADGIFPLLLERLNIFTDPQKPMIITPGIYEIGTPDENSPVAVTTNFALTYFIGSGEIEASKVSTWLLIQDTEGLSVMTAWAAGKFSGDSVAMFVKKCGIADKVKTRTLIIPGYAAGISGDLEEELPDWKVLIGPREASHIPALLKTL